MDASYQQTVFYREGERTLTRGIDYKPTVGVSTKTYAGQRVITLDSTIQSLILSFYKKSYKPNEYGLLFISKDGTLVTAGMVNCYYKRLIERYNITDVTACNQHQLRHTYASRCIENEILMYLRKTGNSKIELSFDEPLSTDWDGNEMTLRDVLGTEPDEISQNIEYEDEKKLLRKIVSNLPEKEKNIMNRRFGLNGYKALTQKQLADELSISQSYISRLEKRIISNLRKEFDKAQKIS